MQGQNQKLAACEIRANQYVKTWETDLLGATGASPGFCCYALWCGWCASYGLRKRALYNDMSRYLCCAGYLPCSGRCGEQKCPGFCLGLEVFCCFGQSVASTRWMLQDEMQLQNTKCDNCIIATMIALQYISCIFSIVAMCIGSDEIRQAAQIIDLIADLVWCSVCACMQTQHKFQLDARDANPGLVMPNNPYMAPVMQHMAAGYPAQGPPPGYGAPPPQNPYSYPGQQPPPQAGYYPPPQGAGYGGAPPPANYPPPPPGYGIPPPQGYPPPPYK